MVGRGLLLVLSGPSGVGKGTVRKHIFDNYNNDFNYSISMTTRQQRDGEIDGQDYYFRSKESFEQLIEDDGLLEYAEYVGHYYGTPLKYVKETLEAGQDVFLEIEVQGALKVRNRMPEAIFIFLAPPNLEELENRIVGRGTDSDDMIKKRMAKAVDELKLIQYYDYVVENDDVDRAAQKIRHIIESEHLKVSRNLGTYTKIIEEME